MSDNTNFLCEIGTEEIPAGYIPSIIRDMENIFRQKLNENRIGFADIKTHATPRRLVIFGSGIAESQTGGELEIKGPSVKAAYDGNGEPTKALSGFINGNKISKEDIFTLKTEKGEYVFALKKMEEKKSEEIIPEIIELIIKNYKCSKKNEMEQQDNRFPEADFVFASNAE